MADVVVIDDDGSLVRLVTHWLEREGHRVRGYLDALEGQRGVSELGADVVLLDLELGDVDGLTVLASLSQAMPQTAVVMMTANGEVPAVVEAMRRGAFDYLAKPVARTKLVTTVRNAVERQRLVAAQGHLERLQQGSSYHGILGNSPAITRLVERLERVAPTDVTVLIQGESGTGKELVAKAIHTQGPRQGGPFIAINCAAIPASLQESELFGHEKGAFTGAESQRKGRFEQANGGTLFLDEVAELSPDLQASLLRVLQERRLHRVGGSQEVPVDVRVLAASHKDLGALAMRGDFREDLFYRLAVFEVEVPPLRERGEDVLLLARHLLHAACSKMGRATPVLSETAASLLVAHRWPGNVRELHNAMESAAVTAGELLRPEDLPRRVRHGHGPGVVLPEPAPRPVAPTSASVDGLSPMERLEYDAIREALARWEGNVSEVIRALGIPRTSLYRKLNKYGLR